MAVSVSSLATTAVMADSVMKTGDDRSVMVRLESPGNSSHQNPLLWSRYNSQASDMRGHLPYTGHQELWSDRPADQLEVK